MKEVRELAKEILRKRAFQEERTVSIRVCGNVPVLFEKHQGAQGGWSRVSGRGMGRSRRQEKEGHGGLEGFYSER